MSQQTAAPFLVRWYAGHIKPRTRGKPSQWDEAWVRGTIRFGWQVFLVGIAALVLCVFLPDDERRWFIAAFSVVTAVVGLWHVRNARAVCELALRQSNQGS